MDTNGIYRDYVNAELDYRRGRIRSDISGRRVRRDLLSRRRDDAWRGDTGDATQTTVF